MSTHDFATTLPADAQTAALHDELDVDLPNAVAAAFQTSLDADTAPDTLDAWVGMLGDLYEDWPPAVADLCHDADGRHRAATGTQSFRFTCVLDAMLLPFLQGEPTTVTSSVPGTDTDVTFRVTDSEVTGSPETVISFGAANRPPAGSVTAAHAYGVICPFIHAFPDADAYEDWAAGVDAATMALSLPVALGLAKAIVRG